MINNDKIREVMEQFGFDELTAWRHLHDRARAQKLYDYQRRQAIRGEFDHG